MIFYLEFTIVSGGLAQCRNEKIKNIKIPPSTALQISKKTNLKIFARQSIAAK